MKIIAYSPRAEPGEAAALGVTLVGSLDEIFARSDYVSLHNRLDASTRGLIQDRHFRLMKPKAYFINVARGEITDQAALVAALKEGRIAGAGLDVFEHEPVPLGDPILSAPERDPHAALAAVHARRRAAHHGDDRRGHAARGEGTRPGECRQSGRAFARGVPGEARAVLRRRYVAKRSAMMARLEFNPPQVDARTPSPLAGEGGAKRRMRGRVRNAEHFVVSIQADAARSQRRTWRPVEPTPHPSLLRKDTFSRKGRRGSREGRRGQSVQQI